MNPMKTTIRKTSAVGTTLARLAAVSSALALTGCATNKLDLPDITAREVFVSHQNPLFNVSINADNLVDHGDHVTADRITYERGGRVTTTVIRVEGYRRDKQPTVSAPSVTVSADSATPAEVATPPPSN